MTKEEIIRATNSRLRCDGVRIGLPVVQKCVETFLDELLTSVTTEVDHIELRKFAVLDVVRQSARQNRMPSGQVVDLPKRGRVRLRLSRRYQDALNKRMAS